MTGSSGNKRKLTTPCGGTLYIQAFKQQPSWVGGQGGAQFIPYAENQIIWQITVPLPIFSSHLTSSLLWNWGLQAPQSCRDPETSQGDIQSPSIAFASCGKKGNVCSLTHAHLGVYVQHSTSGMWPMTVLILLTTLSTRIVYATQVAAS